MRTGVGFDVDNVAAVHAPHTAMKLSPGRIADRKLAGLSLENESCLAEQTQGAMDRS